MFQNLDVIHYVPYQPKPKSFEKCILMIEKQPLKTASVKKSS